MLAEGTNGADFGGILNVSSRDGQRDSGQLGLERDSAVAGNVAGGAVACDLGEVLGAVFADYENPAWNDDTRSWRFGVAVEAAKLGAARRRTLQRALRHALGDRILAS